jgi:predicted  nucleic acid-binding Zn-ribbon protein
MSLPNQLIVSGAGTAAVNGSYTRGANYGEQIAWYLDGDNNFVLFVNNNTFDPGQSENGDYFQKAEIWDVRTDVLYIGFAYVSTSTFSGDFTVFTWDTAGTGFETPPAPTVTAVAAAPATVTFPSSPTLNQSFTAGTRTWVFNGTAWKLQPKTTDAITEGSTNKYYTDARVAAAPAVTALETRAGTIESAASTLAGRVTTAEGSITTLTSGLATEKGRVDAILSAAGADSDSFAEIVTLINSVDTTNDNAFAGYVTSNNAAVSALEGRATAVEGRATTLEGDVATLQSDVTAVEGRLDTVESDITAIESAATTLEGRVTTAEGDIDALQSDHSGMLNAMSALDDRLNVAETDIDAIESAASTLSGRVDTAESDIDALEGRADTLESEMDAAEGRLDTAESDITALETGKQIKNVLSASAPSHVEGLVWIDTTDMSQYVSFGGAWVELDKA